VTDILASMAYGDDSTHGWVLALEGDMARQLLEQPNAEFVDVEIDDQQDLSNQAAEDDGD